MRSGLRKVLLENVSKIKEVYEPSVPNKETERPFVVIEQVADTENNQATIGSERKINIWIYNDRTSFQELDILQKEIINAINFKSIEDEDTKNYFACIYKGVSSSDISDVEWDIIARPISFSIIALEKLDNKTSDKEVEVVSSYLENILKNKNGVTINVFKDNWNQNLTTPCVLCRTTKTERTIKANNLIEIDKTMKIHVVDMDNDRVIQILEHIENKLISDRKIVYKSDGNILKLTLSKLIEDRDADMLTLGQISVTFRNYASIKKNRNPINKIYDDKGLKIKKGN